MKTGLGQYAEGDVFRGIRVPVLRRLVRECEAWDLGQIARFLDSRFHEDRLLATLVLVRQFSRGDAALKKRRVGTLATIVPPTSRLKATSNFRLALCFISRAFCSGLPDSAASSNRFTLGTVTAIRTIVATAIMEIAMAYFSDEMGRSNLKKFE
ncbi:MAG: DNA alkylation repair protein [Verrucomicrobia bacterium]|nr:DNA alkylation repair protein [Verrucomicrobiota bacterium]